MLQTSNTFGALCAVTVRHGATLKIFINGRVVLGFNF